MVNIARGWEILHRGFIRVFLVGIATGSVRVDLRSQPLRDALVPAFRSLKGRLYFGKGESLMIQYYLSSADGDSTLVVTKKTPGVPWQEVCAMIDNGAVLEVCEEGFIKVGKIVRYEWVEGMLVLHTPKRVQRKEEERHGEWVKMVPDLTPFTINPCSIIPVKGEEGSYTFGLSRPGCCGTIRPKKPE